ncbi:MAG TPA: hypothetical protein VGX03_15085 [Candidatus Binatia bacterium]|jgi:hypothetical protein|nr:hypothetical protein [Candidatus Binatia bacterium]
MPRNTTKRPESRCPTCNTVASKTPVGKVRKAAMEAQQAKQEARMEAAQRQAMAQRRQSMAQDQMRGEMQRRAIIAGANGMRPGMGQPGMMAPGMARPPVAAVPQRGQMDPRALAMLAALAQRGGRGR